LAEPKENIGYYHSDCAKKAGLSKSYPNVPLEKFVGKYVKVPFPINSEKKELMWVIVKEVTDDNNLVGSLNNDPVYVDYVKYGDFIKICRDEIVLVMTPGSNKFLSEEDLLQEVDGEEEKKEG
jgi:hypothetical protein